MSDLTTPADFLNALRGLRSLLDNYSIPGQACADAVVQVAALVAAFPAVLDAARRDERVTAAAIAQSHAACSRSDVGRHIARVLKQRAFELPPPTRTPEPAERWNCRCGWSGPRSEEGAAEIAALGVDHRRTPTERNDHG